VTNFESKVASIAVFTEKISFIGYYFNNSNNSKNIRTIDKKQNNGSQTFNLDPTGKSNQSPLSRTESISFYLHLYPNLFHP
jgi:hypothetical protein